MSLYLLRYDCLFLGWSHNPPALIRSILFHMYHKMPYLLYRMWVLLSLTDLALKALFCQKLPDSHSIFRFHHYNKVGYSIIPQHLFLPYLLCLLQWHPHWYCHQKPVILPSTVQRSCNLIHNQKDTILYHHNWSVLPLLQSHRTCIPHKFLLHNLQTIQFHLLFPMLLLPHQKHHLYWYKQNDQYY